MTLISTRKNWVVHWAELIVQMRVNQLQFIRFIWYMSCKSHFWEHTAGSKRVASFNPRLYCPIQRTNLELWDVIYNVRKRSNINLIWCTLTYMNVCFNFNSIYKGCTPIYLRLILSCHSWSLSVIFLTCLQGLEDLGPVGFSWDRQNIRFTMTHENLHPGVLSLPV